MRLNLGMNKRWRYEDSTGIQGYPLNFVTNDNFYRFKNQDDTYHHFKYQDTFK